MENFQLHSLTTEKLSNQQVSLTKTNHSMDDLWH